MGNRVDGQTQINSVLIPAGVFVLRFAGTCAVFYLFFLCRMIGAGGYQAYGADCRIFRTLGRDLYLRSWICDRGCICSLQDDKTGNRLAAVREDRAVCGGVRVNGKITEYPGILKRKVLCGWGRICSRATVCFC